MAEALERTYNVPLRKGAMKAPRYERASKAVRVLRAFLQRHMKSNDVKIGPELNSLILQRGRKNIPHHVEVKAVKTKEGIVRAEYAKTKNLDFLYPKTKEDEDKVKLKIPGLGKKKPTLEKQIEEKEVSVEEKREEVKREILEHPPEKKAEKLPPLKVERKEDVKVESEDAFGRLAGKKTKVKERAKKTKV